MSKQGSLAHIYNLTTFMTGFVKRGSIHTSDLATFKRHSVSEQTVELIFSYISAMM